MYYSTRTALPVAGSAGNDQKFLSPKFCQNYFSHQKPTFSSSMSTIYQFMSIFYNSGKAHTKLLLLAAILLCHHSNSYRIGNSQPRKNFSSSRLKAFTNDSPSRQGNKGARKCSNSIGYVLQNMICTTRSEKRVCSLDSPLSSFSAPKMAETPFFSDKVGMRKAKNKRMHSKSNAFFQWKFRYVPKSVKPMAVATNHNGMIAASGISLLLVLTLVGSNVLLQGEPSASFCWSAWISYLFTMSSRVGLHPLLKASEKNMPARKL